MKRILITGKNSYIGTYIGDWLKRNYALGYSVTSISLREPEWKSMDFSHFDVCFYVAGIAHRKETEDNQELYYKVNTDLAIEVANKAKREGISQFILLSSMSVYGDGCGRIGEKPMPIGKYTTPNPQNHYGKSKLLADIAIDKLRDTHFRVVILRPPIIYGAGCKGNYVRLSKIARLMPVFPVVNNQRSMLYIENLAYFIKRNIDLEEDGLFCPQNAEYISTYKLVKEIADKHKNGIFLINHVEWIFSLFQVKVLQKMFGSFIYQKEDLCEFINFEDSIRKTEGEQ